MKHCIKIQQCFLIHLLEGKKTFEVRKNDRDFQVGDTIEFLPLEDTNYNVYDLNVPLQEYEITYVLSSFPGLQEGFVCLALKGKTKCSK